MKFDYEKFTQIMHDSEMAKKYESELFRKMQTDAMKRIDEYSEKLASTLTPEQKALFNRLESYEVEHESAIEKQAFYKGYMLACSLFIEK